ncbi:MAG UNVERIFIED_CONTAM: hypothetical protein LVR29_14070 [Microcystis novacekii LVE1205-3]|jgi:citrate synthase
MTVCEYRPGLEGIPAAQSSISFVDGQKGILEYRGIRIEELAEKSTFLETAYLLIWGFCPRRRNWKNLPMKSVIIDASSTVSKT